MPALTTIQLRRGSSSQWAASTNPLSQGELGLDTTINKIKIGNGTSLWSSLPWANIMGADFIGTSGINISYASPSGNVTVSVTGLSSSYLSDFNSAVSGLLPVKNIIAGTNIAVSGDNGTFTISTNGLDTNAVKDVIGATITGVSGIRASYDNSSKVETISVTGLTSSYISDFNSSVSGLVNGIYAPLAGATFTGSISSPSGNFTSLTVSEKPVINGGYDYEIHVSQIDGDDTTGNGDLLNPVASITKALTLVGSQRKTIIVHPGTYTESPSITVQYTTITGPGLIGGNIVLSGTLSTNTGCTIAGIKMTNLTITTPTGTGNVNILNCEISGTLTKSSNADYIVLRLCDYGAASITGAGLVAIFGGNPNFTTVNNAGANVIIKSAVTVAPVLTSGTLNLVDSVVVAAVTNAITSAASSVITLANCQMLTSTLSNVAPVVLSGFYSILNCVFDKPNSTLIALSATGGPTNSIDYFQYINADKFITQGGTSSQYVKGDGSLALFPDNIVYTSGNQTISGVKTFSDLPFVNGTGVSISGHSHTSSNITNFNTAVSGLLNVKSLVQGTGIGIVNNGGIQTISVTGIPSSLITDLGNVASTEVVGRTGISLTYDSVYDRMYIDTTGVSFNGHSHTWSNLTDASTKATLTELSYLSGVSPGTVSSGRALVVDNSKNLTGINSLITTGDVTVGGNLTIQGTTTTVNSTTVNIGDNIIRVNTSGLTTGGFEVYDGSVIQSIVWNTVSNRWEFSGGNIYTSGNFVGNLSGNASTVTNGVYTTDSGTVTSTMIANDTIVNADINSSAAIAYSKLNLSNSILNNDIGSSAGIAYSKLNLSGSISNSDISSSAAIAVNKLASSGITLGSTVVNLGGTVSEIAGLTSISGVSTSSPTYLVNCLIDGGTP